MVEALTRQLFQKGDTNCTSLQVWGNLTCHHFHTRKALWQTAGGATITIIIINPFLLWLLLQHLASYENFGQSICPCTGDEWFRRVEGNIMNRFIEFLAMGGDLLDAGFAIQIPQSNRTVMAS